MVTNLTPDTLQKGVCVLVDGGCLNNNKPVDERKMYGSLTVFREGRQVPSRYVVDVDDLLKDKGTQLVWKFSLAEQQGWASNNLAEVIMIRTALRYLWQRIERAICTEKPHYKEFLVMSDSEWALGVVTGQFKIKAANELVYHNFLADIQHYTADLKKHGVTVTYQHVNNQWVKQVLGH